MDLSVRQTLSVCLPIAAFLVTSAGGCKGRAGMDALLLQYETRFRVSDSNGVEYTVDGYRLKNSVDKGKTWVDLGTIPARGLPVWGYALACGEDDVLYFTHVGSGKGKKAVFISRSSDGGNTWTEPAAVNDETWAQRTDPRVLTRGKDVFVAWEERAELGPTGNRRPGGIYVACSHNGGLDWDGDIWMREGEDCWLSPGEDGSIYLAYIGGGLGNLVYISYSDDGGETWHSETTGELKMVIREPYAISLGGTLYLVFKGARTTFADISPGKRIEYETYFRHSGDRGETWSAAAGLKKKVSG